MTPLEIFCRQVRARSEENRQALGLVFNANLLGQTLAILRQELDSMVRVIYLLSLSDSKYREDLIEAAVNGELWRSKEGKGRVTDKEMVELADKLNGWTGSVYKFGCAFIHLSSFHDYQARDPLAAISQSEREALLKHMRAYHFGPRTDSPSLSDLVPYLPGVFDKIAGNLECYVKDLEAGRGLEPNDVKAK